jgi:transposase
MHHSEAFVAFDTAKLRNAVAVAEGGRDGEVRYLGEVDNTEAATAKLAAKLVSGISGSPSASRRAPQATGCTG